MLETWRWFGPNDSISLEKIVQAGASGIVSSLHEIDTGEVWPLAAIRDRQQIIEAAGLKWSVIESIPVHNDIKTRSGNYKRYIANYQQSILNAAEAVVKVICYNFMPVVDWTRTNLMYRLPNASHALRFEMVDFAAYDVFLLQRENASADYSPVILQKASTRFAQMSEAEKILLERNIIAGLPGGDGSYTRESILTAIHQFTSLGTEGFRENLFAFLRDVIPVAEDAGVKMCIHPDDPPFSLFGLPRVVSTASDARALLSAVDTPANGLTLCAGSYGARGDNDLTAMAKEFGPRIYFVHLRNITREADGSFYEAEHLDGDNDMVSLVQALLDEEDRRLCTGDMFQHIPMRPDHGHLMGDEVNQPDVKPGYSYAGRLKGLSELRGVIHTLKALR